MNTTTCAVPKLVTRVVSCVSLQPGEACSDQLLVATGAGVVVVVVASAACPMVHPWMLVVLHRSPAMVEQAHSGYAEGMDSSRVAQKGDTPTVPGTGGPGPDEASVEGRQALQLHAGIAAIAVVLSAFVTWIFFRVGSVPLGVGFGVVAAISLMILGWALYRKRRGERSNNRHWSASS